MLELGSQNISALYVGGTKIKRALVGETVVFEDAQTVSVPTQSGTLTYNVNQGLKMREMRAAAIRPKT